MKKFILFFFILLFSCVKKDSVKSDIVFKIGNKELGERNILTFSIINYSDRDYFICFDTTSIYYNGGLNYRTNDCVHPKPVFYLNNDSIASKPRFSLIKSILIDTAQINCIKRNMEIRENYLNDLKKLKKILIIKSKTKKTLKLPFDNNYIRCNMNYTYLLGKGNYEIQFKYKMDKDYIDKIVDKKILLELKNKKIEPYYMEIISNKVPFIVEKKNSQLPEVSN